MAVNKVILIGNLGQNPEVKHTPGGQAVCNMSFATNESWVDKNGQKQEKTEWHRVVAFGKLAELCGQYLTKGRQSYIEGKLQTRQWQDKDGQTRYTTEIVAQTIQFLGGAGQQSGASRSSQGAYSGQSAASSGYGEPASFSSPGGFGGEPTFTEEDVPF